MSAGPQLVVVPFDELEPGRAYGPFHYSIAQEQSDELRDCVGIAAPGPHAPPGVYTVLFLRAFSDAMGGIPPGGVLLKYEIDLHADLPSAGDVVARVTIGDKAVKRGRERATIEVAFSAGDGPPAVEGRMTIAWASVEEQRAAL